jgi:Universal stress protein family
VSTNWQFETEVEHAGDPGRSRPVVVAVRASQRRDHAGSLWAAAEAARRGLPLRLVHVFTPLCGGPAATMSGWGSYCSSDQIIRDRDAVVCDMFDVAQRAQDSQPGLETIVDIIDGDPVSTLVRVSAEASQIVLGSPTDHPVSAAVQGRLGSAIASRVVVPVVLVPQACISTGVVVAVLNGTEDAAPVLRTAVRFAAQWQCGIRVVASPRSLLRQPDDMIFGLETDVFDILAAVRRARPQLSISASVVRRADLPAEVGALAAARLLVVGRSRARAIRPSKHRSRLRRLAFGASMPVCLVPTS